ncbi:hypothetical protein Adeg_1142 [Ammonifex degensii KC4]|uniref:DUF2225 domain-containing protein n=1 Tax=Ammonifex degensii (strain DSM 10501 / KC4) TaxID=429009 RepID=C9RDD3_AMMDK|nr:DUF2225 domain-containing protein [Ammonifex degensii]ACX52260.1 hypothetical protein Adeg_1142 [Ammonifex degensii KC4]
MAQTVFCRLRCPRCFTSFPAEIALSTGAKGRLSSDLCYRGEGSFVYPYLVVVCPGCGFTSYHQEFDYLAELPRYSPYHPVGRALKNFLQERRHLYPGSEKYRLAAEDAKRRGSSHLDIAHLHLKGSWCAREEGNLEAERYHQEEALHHFRLALKEVVEARDVAVIRYLEGELCRRLGRFEEAEKAFAAIAPTDLPYWLRAAFERMRELATRHDASPQELPRT